MSLADLANADASSPAPPGSPGPPTPFAPFAPLSPMTMTVAAWAPIEPVRTASGKAVVRKSPLQKRTIDPLGHGVLPVLMRDFQVWLTAKKTRRLREVSSPHPIGVGVEVDLRVCRAVSPDPRRADRGQDGEIGRLGVQHRTLPVHGGRRATFVSALVSLKAMGDRASRPECCRWGSTLHGCQLLSTKTQLMDCALRHGSERCPNPLKKLLFFQP